MTEIKEHNKDFAAKEEKENEDLESMIGDITSEGSAEDKTSGSSGGSDDIFDKELKESAKDDHRSLKDSMMDTYRETMNSMNEDDINNTKKQQGNKTLSFAHNKTLALANITKNDSKKLSKAVNATSKPLKYINSTAFHSQKKMLDKVVSIYSNKEYDAAKKVMLFTSEVCLPEIIKQEKHLKDDKTNKTKVDSDAEDSYL